MIQLNQTLSFKKTWILILTVFCSCRVSPNTAQIQDNLSPTDQQPVWIQSKPKLPDYYIGIGQADTRQNDFMKIAKGRALEDLASEIKLNISAVSNFHQSELGYQLMSNYTSEIRTSISDQLQQYEMVEDWIGDHKYWVYYRLSKQDYKNYKSARKQEALDKAYFQFSHSKSLEKSLSLKESIHGYFKCIQLSKNYLDENFSRVVGGNEIRLAEKSWENIIHILSSIRIHPDSVNKGSKILQMPFSQVYAQYENQSLVFFPFVVKSGQVSSFIQSSAKGHLPFTADLFSRDYLKVQVDKSWMFEAYSDDDFISNLIRSIVLSETRIKVSTPVIKMKIDGNANNLGRQVTERHIEPQIMKHLSKAGIQFVSDQFFHLTLSYESSTRKGNQVHGLFISYLDLDIQIMNHSGDVVYKDKIYHLKGAGLSYLEAGIEAYQNLTHSVENRVTDPIIQAIFNLK